jgi:hypothetical protein
MENWKPAKKEKIYEAITAIADERVETNEDKTEAKVYSSSRNKFYTVTYEPETQSIMSNDNSAFYVDEVSYPMIALLMLRGDLKYDKKLLDLLKDIKWKDVNKKHKNNYAKAVEEVLGDLQSDDREFILEAVESVNKDLQGLDLRKLGKKKFPPKGY